MCHNAEKVRELEQDNARLRQALKDINAVSFQLPTFSQVVERMKVIAQEALKL